MTLLLFWPPVDVVNLEVWIRPRCARVKAVFSLTSALGLAVPVRTIRRFAVEESGSPRRRGSGAPSGCEVEGRGRGRRSVPRTRHRPSLGFGASESVVERREHVDEPSPLQSIALKFVLDASNAMQFVTA